MFNYIFERALKKMQGWKQKLLSQAGREILIKAIVQAIPSYSMSCFLLPQKLINKIMLVVRNFWWGGDPSSKTIHWRKWDILSSSKSEGGMGFRDLKAFNLALLAKQCWRLVLNPSSFWARVLKGIYFPRDNFMNAKKGSRASWIWNSLLRGMDVLLASVRWQVGNGKSIHFWSDRWVPNSPHFFVRDAKGPFNLDSFVADFITGGRWNTSKLKDHVSAKAISDIISIPLSFTDAHDRLVWHYTSKGNYTVKSGYYVALKLDKEGLLKADLSSHQATSSLVPSQSFWNQIWSISAQPKLKNFMWRICSNALATQENLFWRNCSHSPFCPICLVNIESVEHMLFECQWTRPIWFSCPLALTPPSASTYSIIQWLLFLLSKWDTRRDRIHLLSNFAFRCLVYLDSEE